MVIMYSWCCTKLAGVLITQELPKLLLVLECRHNKVRSHGLTIMRLICVPYTVFQHYAGALLASVSCPTLCDLSHLLFSVLTLGTGMPLRLRHNATSTPDQVQKAKVLLSCQDTLDTTRHLIYANFTYTISCCVFKPLQISRTLISLQCGVSQWEHWDSNIGVIIRVRAGGILVVYAERTNKNEILSSPSCFLRKNEQLWSQQFF